MKKSCNKIVTSLVALSLSLGAAGIYSVANAATSHPAPYPIIDEWNYGVDSNYGYSNYYVKSPNNIGSKSSVTNLWGVVKASDSKKYGWALSSAKKGWSDVRLSAHWNYFKF